LLGWHSWIVVEVRDGLLLRVFYIGVLPWNTMTMAITYMLAVLHNVQIFCFFVTPFSLASSSHTWSGKSHNVWVIQFNSSYRFHYTDFLCGKNFYGTVMKFLLQWHLLNWNFFKDNYICGVYWVTCIMWHTAQHSIHTTAWNIFTTTLLNI
jgi:hypothetical protein